MTRIDIVSEIKKYKYVVADDDFDGVAASIILGTITIPEHVEYPAPRGSEPRDNTIIIERPERAGKNSIIIDHHAEGNEGYILLPSGDRISFGPKPSVASVVAELVDELPDILNILLKYADIIDSTLPTQVATELSRAGLDAGVYSGYRLLIANPVWRNTIAQYITNGAIIDAARYMIELFSEAGRYADEVLPEIARELAERAETIETSKGLLVIFSVYFGERINNIMGISVDLEQSAMKTAQSILEEEYPDAVAVIAYIKSPKGNGLSIASPKGYASMIATALRDRGFAKSGGGRPNVAGVQRISFEYTEAKDILKRIIEPL